MSDRKFLIIISLSAVLVISLTAALLTMVVLDRQNYSDGTSSPKGGEAPMRLLSPGGS